MSSFPYKNPLSSVQTVGVTTVPRSATFGTSYSVNNTGGYMEVYSLSDLIYTIPTGTTGSIEYTGNTIPIDFIKGTGDAWSPNVLTLGSDNISSGRRRLGMLVYVYEEDQVYQFHISGYTSLFTAATASTDCVVISDFGTTVKNNTAAGQNFINAWTASTIEDVSGYTSSNATWRKFNTGTGGGSGFTSVRINNVSQFTSSSNSYINFSGNNVNISYVSPNTLVFSAGTGGGGGSSNLQYFITGSTPSGVTINSGDRWFDTNTGVEVVYINDGDSSQWVRPSNGMVPLFTGNTSASCVTNLYVSNLYGCSPINVNDLLRANSGLTTTNLTATTISATTYYNLPGDYKITGGTYTQTSGTLSLRNQTGGTININGTWSYITGGTYSAGTITLKTNTGGTTTITDLVGRAGALGTAYFLPRWSSQYDLYDSRIFDSGSFMGFGSTTPSFSEFLRIDTGHDGLTIDNTYFINTTNGSLGIVSGNDYSGWNGSSEIAIGSRGILLNSTGTNNIGIGDLALASNTTGNQNIAIGGTLTLFNNINGVDNIGIGSSSLAQNSSGNNNIGIGTDSLLNNTDSNNIAIGKSAGYTNTFGSRNIYIGTDSGILNDGSNNIFIGYSAGSTDTVSDNKLNIGETIYGDISSKLIGINQSNPVTTLDVSGTTRITGGLTASTISATTYQNLPTDIRVTGATYSNNTFTYTNNTGGTFSVLFNRVTGLTVNGGLTVTGNTSLRATTATTISGDSLTLSNSASTINLNNTTQQQIRFFSGGTGTPTYNSYSAGAKIIFSDNISSISSGFAIGVDTGILWYGADLAGNGHEWYAGTRKLASLIGSTGFQLIGLGGPTTTAMVISGTSSFGSKGGTGYTDFLQVINNWSGATNVNKWFRTNITGGLEILRSDYNATILTLSDSGILAVAGGNLATTTLNDAQTNYLTFGNNNTQIYDDGNTHIHSRSAGQSMWINTNGGQLNLLTQATTSTGSIGSGIAIATGTLNGYVTINTGRTVTTSAAYGYLTTLGAGTYPGGLQTISISLYANNRIWGQEIDAFSDERMKNIEGEISLEDGIKLVKNLIPIKYTWKEGDDKGLKAGYSAQQVIKSGFDHLIGLIPTEGLEETIDEDGFLSPKDTQFAMNYDQVTPYHGVVIKHLLEEIESLKNEIKELKSKIG